MTGRLSLVSVCVAAIAFGQSTASSTVGVVTKVDAAAREIVLKSDAGAEVTVTLGATASFRRVAPGETDLRNASTIALADISAGDRVLARGKSSEDQKSVAATLVVVMSKSDIANKRAAERADWEKRGVVGIVTAVDGNQISINAREPGGVKPLTITPAGDVEIRRYAPDSVKFADARPGKIEEIKAGDTVRARGDKTADGSKMTAEEIVSGSFRTIAATINSIDAAQNEMRVTNLDGKKPMVVKISPGSVLHKLPPQMAQMLAIRNRAAENGAAAAPDAAGGGRGGFPGGCGGGFQGGRGAGPGGFAGRGGDLQQMLDRTPKIALTDLMPGDAIVISSTVGTSADQVTVITLVAGVEPILTAPGRKDMALGSWSLGADLGGAEP